ncbi:MAG: hypothetical protein KKD44_23775 [Proteobacteria bacterium]|nr:hypothetical protein [Pseudomonadota bacterium]
MDTHDTVFKNEKIWIISDSRPSDIKPESIGIKHHGSPIKEYAISDLAWYLLNPEPIVIRDKLVGCHITKKKSTLRKIKDGISRLFFAESNDKDTSKNDLTQEYVSALHLKTYTFKDQAFENHFKSIYKALRPYDSLLKIFGTVNVSDIQEITGICEDIAGNRYRLDLQGTVHDKLNYMVSNLLTPVKITMKKAYLSKGLFELRGFKFKTFNPEKAFRLIRYIQNGEPTYCVLGSEDKPGFVVQEPKLVYCLQLFEQSLRTNEKLYESVELCIKGEAKPFKLFFTKQLEFSYSQNHLPRIFRDNYDISKMAPDEKGAIAQTLNNQQRVISFNYIPHSNSGEEKMHTNISVMHDVRALEHLKDHFPNLFNEIFESAPSSDAGKFYLLDSIKGCQDE